MNGLEVPVFMSKIVLTSLNESCRTVRFIMQ